MKYNGCPALLGRGGENYLASQSPYTVIADDGMTYKSDGHYWQRDPTYSPVSPSVKAPSVPGGAGLPKTVRTIGDGVAPSPQSVFILPTDSAERKNVPLWSGLFQYFPDALVAVARLSWKGNEKHNPGQPLHWSRDKSNDHADCLLRHQMDCGTGEVDPDSGLLHEVEVAWRALAQCQLALERQRQGGKR